MRSSTLACLLLLMLVLVSMHAAAVNPYVGPKPIAVLVETDPWLLVMGSETPLVALYDDGLVVYRERLEDGRRGSYVHYRLSPEQLAEVIEALGIPDLYAGVESNYRLSNGWDLPETLLYLDLAGVEVATRVYGLYEGRDVEQEGKSSRFASRSVPQVVHDLYAYLTSLEFEDASPWTPLYVEVLIWGYGHAVDPSIVWPSTGPGLDSPFTQPRGQGSHIIFLPGPMLPVLNSFLAQRQPRGTVLIDGRKFALSVKYAFPSEPVWRAVFY